VPQSNSTGAFQKTNIISPTSLFLNYGKVDIDADWALGYAGPDIGTLFDNATTTFINPLYCSDCLPENFTTLLVDLGILLYQEFLAFANVPSVFCIPS
jgi:hypothetical protein